MVVVLRYGRYTTYFNFSSIGPVIVAIFTKDHSELVKNAKNGTHLDILFATDALGV